MLNRASQPAAHLWNEDSRVSVIIGVDPGETTGYASVRYKGGSRFKVVECGELFYPRGINNLLQMILKTKPVVVAIEDFILRKALIGDHLITARVIGGFEIVLPEHLVVLQQPSEKVRCPNELLKKLGLWHRSPHVRDAFRHCVIWVQKKFF